MFKNLLITLSVSTVSLLLLIGNINVTTQKHNSQSKHVKTKKQLAISESFSYTHATGTDFEYSKDFDQLQFRYYDGKTYRSDSKSDTRSLTQCKSLVYQAYMALPEEHRIHLKHLTLYFTETGTRGMAGGNTMILRCSNVTKEELVSVFIHEMGHIIDTGKMNGRKKAGKSKFKDFDRAIYNDDLSLEFYKLSWIDDKTLKKSSKKQDFVSGYAMSDPFEDFAETYNYYILHNQDFKILAKYNKVLKYKYEFMKNSVFNGQKYSVSDVSVLDTSLRNYDTTVLPYNLPRFLSK